MSLALDYAELVDPMRTHVVPQLSGATCYSLARSCRWGYRVARGALPHWTFACSRFWLLEQAANADEIALAVYHAERMTATPFPNAALDLIVEACGRTSSVGWCAVAQRRVFNILRPIAFGGSYDTGVARIAFDLGYSSRLPPDPDMPPLTMMGEVPSFSDILCACRTDVSLEWYTAVCQSARRASCQIALLPYPFPRLDIRRLAGILDLVRPRLDFEALENVGALLCYIHMAPPAMDTDPFEQALREWLAHPQLVAREPATLILNRLPRGDNHRYNYGLMIEHQVRRRWTCMSCKEGIKHDH